MCAIPLRSKIEAHMIWRRDRGEGVFSFRGL
jgi:hypothetical protein